MLYWNHTKMWIVIENEKPTDGVTKTIKVFNFCMTFIHVFSVPMSAKRKRNAVHRHMGQACLCVIVWLALRILCIRTSVSTYPRDEQQSKILYFFVCFMLSAYRNCACICFYAQLLAKHVQYTHWWIITLHCICVVFISSPMIESIFGKVI